MNFFSAIIIIYYQNIDFFHVNQYVEKLNNCSFLVLISFVPILTFQVIFFKSDSHSTWQMYFSSEVQLAAFHVPDVGHWAPRHIEEQARLSSTTGSRSSPVIPQFVCGMSPSGIIISKVFIYVHLGALSMFKYLIKFGNVRVFRFHSTIIKNQTILT